MSRPEQRVAAIPAGDVENLDQAGGCTYNYSCAYTDTISWASPNEPLPMIRDPRVAFDMLFGPAYKGIPLVAAVAMALAQAGHNHPFAFNRKESKDHGEGGNIIGAALSGRVLIVDDAISAGTAVRESYGIIVAGKATPCGVMVALDRMERGLGPLSAVQEVEQNYNIHVISIATLDDLVSYLESDRAFGRELEAVNRYREQYGVRAHA